MEIIFEPSFDDQELLGSSETSGPQTASLPGSGTKVDAAQIFK